MDKTFGLIEIEMKVVTVTFVLCSCLMDRSFGLIEMENKQIFAEALPPEL